MTHEDAPGRTAGGSIGAFLATWGKSSGVFLPLHFETFGFKEVAETGNGVQYFNKVKQQWRHILVKLL